MPAVLLLAARCAAAVAVQSAACSRLDKNNRHRESSAFLRGSHHCTHFSCAGSPLISSALVGCRFNAMNALSEASAGAAVLRW